MSRSAAADGARGWLDRIERLGNALPDPTTLFLIGAVAALVTFATTPLVGMLARHQGWVYLPNDRTVHQSPLPDVGGMAMFVGLLAAMLTASLLGSFDVMFASNSEPIGVLVAATIIYVVGFIDDILPAGTCC